MCSHVEEKSWLRTACNTYTCQYLDGWFMTQLDKLLQKKTRPTFDLYLSSARVVLLRTLTHWKKSYWRLSHCECCYDKSKRLVWEKKKFYWDNRWEIMRHSHRTHESLWRWWTTSWFRFCKILVREQRNMKSTRLQTFTSELHSGI